MTDAWAWTSAADDLECVDVAADIEPSEAAMLAEDLRHAEQRCAELEAEVRVLLAERATMTKRHGALQRQIATLLRAMLEEVSDV